MAKRFIARAEDIPPGNMIGVEVDGLRMLVANVDGQFFAMRSVCNHLGGPLDKGTLAGNVVTCPLHGSQWDVKTGKLVKFTRQLPPEQTYKVSLEGDQVFIEG